MGIECSGELGCLDAVTSSWVFLLLLEYHKSFHHEHIKEFDLKWEHLACNGDNPDLPALVDAKMTPGSCLRFGNQVIDRMAFNCQSAKRSQLMSRQVLEYS